MDKPFENILKPILETFQPAKGKLSHVIISDRSKTNLISSLSITVESEKYTYIDPFYGEIDANNPMQEFINIDCDLAKLELNNWKDIENLELPEGDGIDGFFSNSLEVVPTNLNFGTVNSQSQIKLSVEYYLTNSDTYPAMNGTKKDHSNYKGKLELLLNIESLLVLDKRKGKKREFDDFVDKETYDLDSITNENLWVSEEWYKYYRIGIKK